MKEFIEKLIGRLEEEKEGAKKRNAFDSELSYKRAIEIVNQLAEEYKGNLSENLTGWVPCSERLPELTEGTECFKQSPCCLVTLKWWDGDMTQSVGWYNQSGVWNEDSKNCKVVAWMPLPPKYQPKGE